MAVVFSEKTGLTFEEIMLSDGSQLKKKFFLAYSVQNEKEA